MAGCRWTTARSRRARSACSLGELPHRDFAELYTGGLSFLNAGVLWLTGGNLFWLRVPMFLLFLAYLPCVYLIARRFASPAVATLAALFAVAWGPPVYPAAMPSWYALYLAVIGAYFLVRHHETGGRAGCSRRASWAGSPSLQDHRRLVRAGGRRVSRVPRAGPRGAATERGASARRARSRGGSFRGRAASVSALFVGAVLAEKLGAAEPSTSPAGGGRLRPGGVARAPWRARTTIGRRSRSCSAAPFLAGVTPHSRPRSLVAPYLATGPLGDLYTGLFVTPRGRLEYGVLREPPRPSRSSSAYPTSSSCYALGRREPRARITDIAASAALAALLLLSTARSSAT